MPERTYVVELLSTQEAESPREAVLKVARAAPALIWQVTEESGEQSYIDLTHPDEDYPDA